MNGASPVIAFTNVHGSDVGWSCDGQEHTLSFDLAADGDWQPGSARATFDVTVTDGTDTAADFARKNFRIR